MPRVPPIGIAALLALAAPASSRGEPAAAVPPPLVREDLLAGTPLDVAPLLRSASEEVAGSPLLLEEAVATALARNPDLAQRLLGPAIGEAELRAREGVYALALFVEGSAERHVTPASSALAGADRLDDRLYVFGGGLTKPVAPTGGAVSLSVMNDVAETNSSFAALSPEYVPRLALAIEQPLLRGLLTDERRTAIRVAELGADIASLELAQGMRDTIADVEARYWELFFTMQDVRVKRLALELGNRLLQNDRRRFELGALPWPDVVDVEAAVASVTDTLIAAREAFRDSSDRLRRTMGLPLDGPPLLAAELPAPAREPDALDPLLERAREQREDLRIARAEVGQREAELAGAENRRLPGLDLVGSVGLNGLSGTGRPVSFGDEPPTLSPFAGSFLDSYEELGSGDYFDWVVGLRLSVPLESDSDDARADIARLERDSSTRGLARIEADADLEVRRAHHAVATSAARVVSTAEVVARAEENLKAEARRYELGASRTDDVIRKIEELIDAMTRAERVRATHAVAHAALERAVATSLERRGIRLETRGTSGASEPAR